MDVRLADTRPLATGADNGGVETERRGPAPLRVVGIVVHKTALVEALRAYVPALSDLRPAEDGEHFLLMLGEAAGQK